MKNFRSWFEENQGLNGWEIHSHLTKMRRDSPEDFRNYGLPYTQGMIVHNDGNVYEKKWDASLDRKKWSHVDDSTPKKTPENEEHFARDKYGHEVVNHHELYRKKAIEEVSDKVKIVGGHDLSQINGRVPRGTKPSPDKVWETAIQYGTNLRMLSNDKGEVIIGGANAHMYLPNRYTFSGSGELFYMRWFINPDSKMITLSSTDVGSKDETVKAEFWKRPDKFINLTLRSLVDSGLVNGGWRVEAGTQAHALGAPLKTVGDWLGFKSKADIDADLARKAQEKFDRDAEYRATWPARRYMRELMRRGEGPWHLPRGEAHQWSFAKYVSLRENMVLS